MRLVIIAILFCLLLPSQGFSAACTQSNDYSVWGINTSDGSWWQATPNAWLAQQFTVSNTLTGITGIWWSGTDYGNNGDFTAEVWTDSGGSPGARVGDGYTKTTAGSEINDAGHREFFYFAATQTLSNGTYWVVIKTPDTVHYSTAGNQGTAKVSTNSGASWSDLSTGTKPAMGIMGCRADGVIFQDNFDNWPTVGGNDWYCCNTRGTGAALCDSKNPAPYPWDNNGVDYCGVGAVTSGSAGNTVKIMAGGRNGGKALGICRAGGESVLGGYWGYLVADIDGSLFSASKIYVRYYKKWPATLDKALASPNVWKNDRFGMTGGTDIYFEGYGATYSDTLQDGKFGWGQTGSTPWALPATESRIPVTTFNSDFVYLEYMFDVANDTITVWYGDTYNTEGNPYYTSSSATFDGTAILFHRYGIGNTSDWGDWTTEAYHDANIDEVDPVGGTCGPAVRCCPDQGSVVGDCRGYQETDWSNETWQCMMMDSLVVSTQWVGPENPPTHSGQSISGGSWQ